jgi:hypothetical protein
VEVPSTTAPSSGQAPKLPIKAAAAYLAALRVPFILLCIFGVALGAYYFLHVSGARDYLTARNFRLLAKLGEQIDNTIENDRNVLIRLRKVLPTIKDGEEEARHVASFVPLLRSSTVLYANEHLVETDHVTVSLSFVERESRQMWVRRDDLVTPKGERLAAMVVRELDDLLKPLLSDGIQKSIFDTLLVATPDGRVIFQTGDPKLRVTRLDQLQVAGSKPPPDLKFQQLARSSGTVNVNLSGAQYELLVQPCCGRMVPEDKPPATPDTVTRREVEQKPTSSDDQSGWVLCALKAQQRMSAESAAVSFPMMAILTAVLLFAFLSWPFLKLTLIGEAQRVKVADVVLVGFCALLGVALITVGVLGFYGHRRLQALLDDQLQRFAASIIDQTNKEVENAYVQMTRIEGALGKMPKNWPRACLADGDSTRSECSAVANLASDKEFAAGMLEAYPFFESLAFIDGAGVQKMKLALGSFVTPLIEVGPRDYFAYWKLESSKARAFLQPVRSFTTGTREAVLSKRTSVQRGGDFKVASLTIPLRALIDPVIVPGFGFAVIDRNGDVLFHSDPRHSLVENFFDESDRSRRLRALVAAKHQEWVDIRYWGDEHRALVTPMEIGAGSNSAESGTALYGQPWTLVTFYAKDVPRTVTVEWLVLVLALTILYAAVYVIICLVALFVRPKYRAPWLWPDPARSRLYLDLLPPLLLLTAAGALSIAILVPGELVRVAFLLPFLGWLLVYALLTTHVDWSRLGWIGAFGLLILSPLLTVVIRKTPVRAESVMWRWAIVALLAFAIAWTVATVQRARKRGSAPLAPPVNITYGVAATVFLVLIAVLPAAAFFRIAYDVHLENFIKYGQLQIAVDRADHSRRTEAATSAQISPADTAKKIRELRVGQASDFGVYDAFFFCTGPVGRGTPDCGTADERVALANRPDEPAALPELVEEHLPFYSESSVRFRELVHDRTTDLSWSWRRAGRSLMFQMRGPASPLLASIKPPFVEWPDDGTVLVQLLWLIGALVIIGTVLWVVRFVMHKVFIVDVIEPLWSGSAESLKDSGGSHLFLVGAESPSQTLPATYCEINLADAPEADQAEDRWFDEQVERLGQSPAGQSVLIRHFERRLQNRRFNERKLALVERIVTVLNRSIAIVSMAPPGHFFTSVPVGSGSEVAGDWSRRWAEVLSRFVVIPVNAVGPEPEAALPGAEVLSNWTTGGWREIVWRLNALGFAHSSRFLDDERREPQVDRFWREILPYAWHPGRPALDLRQLLIEVGDRAESYYAEIWATCTPAEKLVLSQIGQEGLANERTKRTIRLLMARGLVRRQPNFALMTETFRQFVLSSKAEVEALEGQFSSAWDRIRWPFLTALIVGAVFFYVTQREAFNTALGLLTATATVVPAVAKMAGLFGERRSA